MKERVEPGELLQGLLKSLVEELVDIPGETSVQKTISDGGNTVMLTVKTANGEVGKVIGKQGKNAQAKEAYQTAITKKSDFCPGYYNMGVLLYKEGQIAEAMKYLRRVEELSPGFKDVRRYLKR